MLWDTVIRTKKVYSLLCVYKVYTWNSVWWQFASGQHYISEVERAVVDVAELHIGVAAHIVAEWGGNPAQRRQVTSS